VSASPERSPSPTGSRRPTHGLRLRSTAFSMPPRATAGRSASASACCTGCRAAQAAERLAAGEAWEDEDLIITTRVGRLVLPRSFDRALERIVAAAELPRLTSHGLRHTAATHMVQGATDLGELRAIGRSARAQPRDADEHLRARAAAEPVGGRRSNRSPNHLTGRRRSVGVERVDDRLGGRLRMAGTSRLTTSPMMSWSTWKYAWARITRVPMISRQGISGWADRNSSERWVAASPSTSIHRCAAAWTTGSVASVSHRRRHAR
jgi:hypothetical protein